MEEKRDLGFWFVFLLIYEKKIYFHIRRIHLHMCNYLQSFVKDISPFLMHIEFMLRIYLSNLTLMIKHLKAIKQII